MGPETISFPALNPQYPLKGESIMAGFNKDELKELPEFKEGEKTAIFAAEREAGRLNIPRPKFQPVRLTKYGQSPTNIRTAGSVIGGTAIADTYDIPGMVADLLSERGKVLEPVTVCELAGNNIVVRGNRRAGAANAIESATIDQWAEWTKLHGKAGETIDAFRAEVMDNLGKVPAIVYPALTERQVVFLTDDQTAKTYNSYELVTQIAHLYDQGFAYADVRSMMFPKMHTLTGKTGSWSAAANETNLAERDKKITSYCEGVLRQGIWNALTIGGKVRETLILWHAYRNGIATTETDGPNGKVVSRITFDPRKPGPCYYIPTNQRHVALMKCRTADSNAGLIENGILPPSVIEQMDLFHAEDTGPKDEVIPLLKPLAKDKVKTLHDSYNGEGLQPVIRAFAGYKPGGKAGMTENSLKELDVLIVRAKALVACGLLPINLATMPESEFAAIINKA